LNDVVHHPTDIGKASATFRVFGGALTSGSLLFGYNFIHDGGSAVLQDIPLDIQSGVIETVANQVFH
jgi:hypothetical protein